MNHHSPTAESGTEEVQNMTPQNMSLWHIAYSKLKALEKQQMQEGISDLPLSNSKLIIKFTMRKYRPLYQREKNSKITRAWVY